MPEYTLEFDIVLEGDTLKYKQLIQFYPRTSQLTLQLNTQDKRIHNMCLVYEGKEFYMIKNNKGFSLKLNCLNAAEKMCSYQFMAEVQEGRSLKYCYSELLLLDIRADNFSKEPVDNLQLLNYEISKKIKWRS